MTAQTLDGPRFGPAAGGQPSRLVILLHGLGADGNDLIQLAPILGQVLPDALFVSPDAPEPCDMAPFGRQWFSLQDRAEGVMKAGVQAAAGVLDAFIDAELEAAGLADDRLALVGFSQGTMMALHVGPRRARPLAGILGFSGALVGAEELARDVRSTPPVLLIHGDADEVVPHAALGLAVQGLTAAGLPVDQMTCPGLGHGIDQSGLEKGAEFLMKVLG